MTVYAYIDGASRGNPGESGIGIVLKDENGNAIESISGYVGKATNNLAEYYALLACLKKAVKLDCKRIVIHTDSELLARQINGIYRVKNPGIKRVYTLVQELISTANFDIKVRHIPREKNSEADELANTGIDRKVRIKI